MKRANLLFLVAWCISVFVACDNSESYEKEHTEIVVRGVVDNVPAKAVPEDTERDYSACPVIFKGNNIEWFNLKNGEIKFSQIEPYEIYKTYQRIVFEINGEQLFTAATIVTDAASFVCNDLVLYYDLHGGYYLKDAYPDFALNHEQTKKNIEKRKNGWNKFLKQMNKEKRLKQ